MATKTGSPDYMTVDYVAHQQQYRRTPRRSDGVIFDILKREGYDRGSRSVLDLGCHNGNLLFHLKHRFPALQLTGGDIAHEVIAECRRDPQLQGVSFEIIDVLAFDRPESADCVIANAVLARFSDEEFRAAWRNIYSAVKPGGIAIEFNWYHSFTQTLRIIEETPAHPHGLFINLRSIIDLEGMLKEIGFSEVEYLPFDVGIDLPLLKSSDPMHTHTRALADGGRLQFRGAMFQPWSHVVARK